MDELYKERLASATEFRDAAYARKIWSEEGQKSLSPIGYDEKEYHKILGTVIYQCEDRINMLVLIFPELKTIPVRPWPRSEERP
jgi:hypothetical protein